jgi:hypothetical protein
MLCFLMFSCTYFITSHVFIIMLYLVVPVLSASMSFLLCYVSFHHASVPVQSNVCLFVQCIYYVFVTINAIFAPKCALKVGSGLES